MSQSIAHGSARFMEFSDLAETEIITNDGIRMGYFGHDGKGWPIRYDGDEHMFTVARTRSGKGVSSIIPTLLMYEGSAFVIDVKGENAIVTADRRRAMGQNVQILDPWRNALRVLADDLGYTGEDAFEPAGFNPLDLLDADSPELVDDCRMIADTLVMETGGDSHWSGEATALLATFIGDVVTNPDEEGQRHLPRVRDILGQSGDEVMTRIEDMAKSPVAFVAKGANQLMQKTEKELQSVLSTANANTHFLDSPALRETLEKSTFDFADLKNDENPLTVFLVLPAERLHTHGRWLRVLVSMALSSMTRQGRKPEKSALFILDEFAALGRLSMVEQAFGLMAGYGLRVWAILQDMSQLKDLYPKRWQTFIANAGMVQVFGVSDLATAQYFSQTMGRGTHEKMSQRTAKMREGGFMRKADPDYTGMADQEFGRELMMPDEIIAMGKNHQIIMLAGQQPIMALKLPYFRNGLHYKNKRDKLYDQHPDHPEYDGDLKYWDFQNAPRTFGLPNLKKWGARIGVVAVLVGGVALGLPYLARAQYIETHTHWDAKTLYAQATPTQCAIMSWGYRSISTKGDDFVMVSNDAYWGAKAGDILQRQPNGDFVPVAVASPKKWKATITATDMHERGIGRVNITPPCPE